MVAQVGFEGRWCAFCDHVRRLPFLIITVYQTKEVVLIFSGNDLVCFKSFGFSRNLDQRLGRIRDSGCATSNAKITGAARLDRTTPGTLRGARLSYVRVVFDVSENARTLH